LHNRYTREAHNNQIWDTNSLQAPEQLTVCGFECCPGRLWGAVGAEIVSVPESPGTFEIRATFVVFAHWFGRRRGAKRFQRFLWVPLESTFRRLEAIPYTIVLTLEEVAMHAQPQTDNEDFHAENYQ